MPDVYPIQYNVFTGLFERLGIITPPRVPQFWMSDVIQPVSIVDSNITLQADFANPAQSFATEGVQVAPAANDLLADTGQLEAGTYTFKCFFNTNEDSSDANITIEHRNAANSAAHWEYRWFHERNTSYDHTFGFTETFLQDERLRIRCVNAGSAGKLYVGFLWRHKHS